MRLSGVIADRLLKFFAAAAELNPSKFGSTKRRLV